MLPRIRLAVWLIAVLTFLLGCMTSIKEEVTTKERLVDAYHWYDVHAQLLKTYYQQVGAGEQAVLNEHVLPLAKEASMALDIWEAHKDVQTSYEKEKEWLRAREMFYAALVKFNIIPLEGGP